MYYSEGFPITVLRLSQLLGYKGIIKRKKLLLNSYNVTSKYVWSIIDWVQKCAACLNVIARMESRPFNYNNSNDFIYWPSDINVNNARIEMLKGNISEFSDLWIHELI